MGKFEEEHHPKWRRRTKKSLECPIKSDYGNLIALVAFLVLEIRQVSLAGHFQGCTLLFRVASWDKGFHPLYLCLCDCALDNNWDWQDNAKDWTIVFKNHRPLIDAAKSNLIGPSTYLYAATYYLGPGPARCRWRWARSCSRKTSEWWDWWTSCSACDSTTRY